MKSKELKTYNLPSDNVVISSINAKPTWLFVVLVILGIIALAEGNQPIYGLMMISIGILCSLFMPKVPLIEFYRDCLVMYNRAEKNKCVLIYYNEVTSWNYSWNPRNDYLIIELEDGSVEKIKAFSKTMFELYMNRFLKDKRKKNQ